MKLHTPDQSVWARCLVGRTAKFKTRAYRSGAKIICIFYQTQALRLAISPKPFEQMIKKMGGIWL
jgi:hypothetical protein